ncbi:MAG TPA: tetratricopeptide repeat protein [Candidatus Binatia bacterium]|nr:tetratricopeptide repeat protein [Candidatus Binatia bacterium]
MLATFLAAGLTVWTFILTPDAPRPLAPPPAASAAPAAAPGQRQGKVELPAEVKSFIAELSGKAKEKPDDTDTWLKLGQVNARASQLDPAFQGDAIAAFEHVLERDPKNADALRGLANVHYDRDDHRKAIPAYEKYLAIRPEDPSARTDLATMYLYGGDPDRAIATYQAVIRDNPSFLQAHYNLAVTYHGQGNDTEALKELQIARGLATEDAARKQIDDMIASLGGTRPAPADGAPTASVAAQPAPRAPFQTAVEAAFRASPIMGSRIVRFDWSGPASGTVVVQNFPMEGMPAEVRDKFTARLTQEVRSARESHPTDGPVRLDISDAGSGKVMASITL